MKDLSAMAGFFIGVNLSLIHYGNLLDEPKKWE
jgi:hypothetical protein